MKLKTKPIFPERVTVHDELLNIEEGNSLQDIASYFSGCKLEDIKIGRDHYYEGSETYFYVVKPEPEEHYNKRIKEYEICLAAYEKWFEENKEEVEEIIKIREERQKLSIRMKELSKRRKEIISEKTS